MNYLIILAVCVLASMKVSFQSAFGKKNIKTSADALLFNVLVFAVSSLLFMPRVIGCSAGVWMYAVGPAVFALSYQFFYTNALSVGSVSLTVLIVNFSVVINVAISYIFYKEPLSALRITAIIFIIISFVICIGTESDRKFSKKWLVNTLLAMISSSGGTIAQKIFGESRYRLETSAFVSCFYAIATILALGGYCVLRIKGNKKTFILNFNGIKYALAVGICLALFQVVNTYSLGIIDGTFYFPVYTGGTIILSTLSGVLIFKDKLNIRQISGIVIGIVSMVLMNF